MSIRARKEGESPSIIPRSKEKKLALVPAVQEGDAVGLSAPLGPHNREIEGVRRGDIAVIEAEPGGWIEAIRGTIADAYSEFHRKFVKPNVKRNDPSYRDLLRSDSYKELWMETLENVSDDEIGSSERAKAFVAFTEKSGFMGTARLVQGVDPNATIHSPRYPIETFKYWRPNPPHEWPHKRKGLRDDEIGDVGRIVVAEDQRPHNTAVILKSLFDKIFEHSRENGIKELYITVPTNPPRLYNRLREIGIRPKLVEGVQLREREPEALEVMDTFSGYWREQDPQLFRIKVPQRAGSKVKKVTDIYVNQWIGWHQREILKKKAA